jgi:hypothetical protein
MNRRDFLKILTSAAAAVCAAPEAKAILGLDTIDIVEIGEAHRPFSYETGTLYAVRRMHGPVEVARRDLWVTDKFWEVSEQIPGAMEEVLEAMITETGLEPGAGKTEPIALRVFRSRPGITEHNEPDPITGARVPRSGHLMNSRFGADREFRQRITRARNGISPHDG